MVGKDQKVYFEYFKWKELYKEEKPYEVFIQIPDHIEHSRRTNLTFERVAEQTVQDIRGEEFKFTLDQNGFQYLKAPTSFTAFKDRTAVERVYQRECEELLKKHVDSVDRVFFFNWRLRLSMDGLPTRRFDLNNPVDPVVPAAYPHVDESINGAVQRVRKWMGEEAEGLLKGRVRLINIWRPLRRVQDWPLAVCDGQTVKSDDLVASDNIRTKYIGENLFAKYSPDYRWYYLSEQEPDEVLLLKIYDSDSKVIGRCPHAAFKMRDPGQGSTPRESIEFRAIVFTNPVQSTGSTSS